MQALIFGYGKQAGLHLLRCSGLLRRSGSVYHPVMPTISSFFGLVIQMFWREHAPPHFHALYAEYEAEIDIRTLEVLQGNLPRRALALVLEWAAEHRHELMEDWTLCQTKQLPKNIPPLK